jgi:hypothetical protein
MIHITNQGVTPNKLTLVKKSLYVRTLKEIEYLNSEIEKLEKLENNYKDAIPHIELVGTQDDLENSHKRVKKHVYIKALTQLEYLKAKLNILTSNKNKGEQDEVLLILKLFNLNETQNYEELEKIFRTDAASEGITIYNMNDGTEIKNYSEISKAKSSFKADISFKMNKTNQTFNASIKSVNGGKPTILNHSTRDKPVFQKGELSGYLPEIDTFISKYHELRINESYPEEIKFSNLHNFTEKDRETLIKVLHHFMFNGSKKNADCILIIHGDTIIFKNLPTVKEQIEYIKTTYDMYDISLVSRKGLPKEIKFKDEAEEKCKTDINYKKQYELMQPWIYETTDNGKKNPLNKIKLKAALHIRVDYKKLGNIFT